MPSTPQHRKSVEDIASELIALYGVPFGGRESGKFRISRKNLRLLFGRRHLSDRLLERLREEMFEQGFVLIDLETHYVVVDQRLLNNYRRVTSAAVERVTDASHPAEAEDVAASP